MNMQKHVEYEMEKLQRQIAQDNRKLELLRHLIREYDVKPNKRLKIIRTNLSEST